MATTHDLTPPGRLIRFCGADCGQCGTYRAFLSGDEGGLVNLQTGYRCCWLPADYPDGRSCPIKTCCERHAVLFCGMCDQFDRCERIQAFHAQPGYDALRLRMFSAIERRMERAESPAPGGELG